MKKKSELEDDKIIFTDSIIKNIKLKSKYKPLTNIQEKFYIKKLKLSYYYDDINEEDRNLYIKYYCDVTPGFKKEYYNCLPEEKKDILDEAIDESRKWRDRFLRNNYNLILYAIKDKYITSNEEDLFQEGLIGMMRALKNYDLEKGYKFSTYAVWTINSAVNRYIWKANNYFNISKNMYERVNKYIFVVNNLKYKLLREPTLDEIIEATGFSLKIISFIRDYIYYGNVDSLDMSISNEEDLFLLDIISSDEDISKNVLDEIFNRDFRKFLNSFKMSSSAKKILYMKYGLTGDKALSSEDIADKMGISVSKVKGLEKMGLKQIRDNIIDLDFYDDVFVSKSKTKVYKK